MWGTNMMKMKIMVVSLLAVFMLVAISYASAINTNKNINTNIKKKESPLYKVRTIRAIGEKLGKIFKELCK